MSDQTPPAERKSVKYRMKSHGSTTGKYSGQRFTWEPGKEIETVDGDFEHLGGGDCEQIKTRRKKAKKDDEVDAGTYENRAMTT